MTTGSIIELPFYCSYGQNIHIGDHVYLNFLCTILDNNAVRIGDHVMVGPAVQIYTAAHPLQAEPRIQGWEAAKPIVIEDNVWLGGGAIILPGVSIGRNACRREPEVTVGPDRLYEGSRAQGQSSPAVFQRIWSWRVIRPG